MNNEESQSIKPDAVRCFRAYGFDPCDFEPGNCDRCKQVKTLYFGDRSFEDSREGSYLCGECLDERIAADKEYAAYMEQMIENQRDHEASHMPWML